MSTKNKGRTLRAPRGTADVFPDEMALVRTLEDAARAVFAAYGYGEVRVPTFEHVELFIRGIGEATDIVEKEMYTFGEADGDTFALRPEGTASVVRAYVEKGLDKAGGFTKLHYIGSMFRRERPQAGRMREFIQIGAEALGSEEACVDAELIAMAMRIYDRVGMTGHALKINSIGCHACRSVYREVLKGLLAPRSDALCDDCRRRLDRNVFRVLDCKNPACKAIAAEMPPMREHLDDACATHLDTVLALLAEAAVPHDIDDHLVRGFDYYTRTVWEIVHPGLGARSAICGGGRYDNLVEETGGRPNGASGFSIGEVPTLLALQQEGRVIAEADTPRLFLVAFDDICRSACFRIALALRAEGIACELDYQARSFKAQMRAANRCEADYTVVIGPDEMKTNTVSLKNMDTGEETAVDIDRLANALRAAE